MSITGQVIERRSDRNRTPAAVGELFDRRMELGDAIRFYTSVGRRNIDYFDWIHAVYSWICLPCVSFDWRKVLGEDKTKMAIFDILVDDLADNFNTPSKGLLEQFIQIPWQNAIERNEYLDVGKLIWEDYIASVSSYPRFKEFERMFYFDLRQVLSSMVYSSLVNTMELDNSIEMDIYSSYGCMVILAVDMDLMCSPSFDMKDLGKMRAVAYLGQKVAHIGNMLNTYRCEVLERDLSCPIISLAVRRGLIDRNELGDESIIPRLSKLEEIFEKRAHSYIQRASTYERQIRSVNIRGFSEFLTELLHRFKESRSLR